MHSGLALDVIAEKNAVGQRGTAALVTEAERQRLQTIVHHIEDRAVSRSRWALTVGDQVVGVHCHAIHSPFGTLISPVPHELRCLFRRAPIRDAALANPPDLASGSQFLVFRDVSIVIQHDREAAIHVFVSVAGDPRPGRVELLDTIGEHKGFVV